MTFTTAAIVFGLGGLVLGTIPFALLLGLANGLDVRTVGSKNVGATNLGRALGFKWFMVCFVLDAAKGAAATVGFGLATGSLGRAALELDAGQAGAWLVVAAAPVFGHMFSPWVGFKGGKGVATGLGALLGVFPVLTLPAIGSLCVFLAVLGLWKYVGLASVVAAGTLPLWTWYLYSLLLTEREKIAADSAPVDIFTTEIPNVDEPVRWPFIALTVILAMAVIWKHRGNLERLAEGTEPKVNAGPDEGPAGGGAGGGAGTGASKPG